jgi:hypothetical protein
MKLRSLMILGAAGLLASWVLDELKQSDRTRRDKQDRIAGQKREDNLTSAIENTFPASDPYQVGKPTAHDVGAPMNRRPAELDPASIARQVELLDRKRSEQGV